MGHFHLYLTLKHSLTRSQTHVAHSTKYLSCVFSSVNRGLLLGSYDQHFVIKL